MAAKNQPLPPVMICAAPNRISRLIQTNVTMRTFSIKLTLGLGSLTKGSSSSKGIDCRT